MSGLARLHGPQSRLRIAPRTEDAAKLLLRALDLGYNLIDTARLYDAGKNKTLIGETLKHPFPE